MNTVIEFIKTHDVLFAALAVDLLNMLIAFIPSFQSNSIIHWVLQQLMSINKPKA